MFGASLPTLILVFILAVLMFTVGFNFGLHFFVPQYAHETIVSDNVNNGVERLVNKDNKMVTTLPLLPGVIKDLVPVNEAPPAIPVNEAPPAIPVASKRPTKQIPTRPPKRTTDKPIAIVPLPKVDPIEPPAIKPVAAHANAGAPKFVQNIINDKQLACSKPNALPSPNGPISMYVNAGKLIPIILLTCNRPELLDLTIQSLLAVKGVVKSQILVIQDGGFQPVVDVVNKYGLTLNQNNVNLRGGVGGDGGQRIAMHYKYALSKAFAVNPDAPAVIIVEDDLLFSPDFYEYFATVAPILEEDPSTFVVSAWNDNGFKGKVPDAMAYTANLASSGHQSTLLINPFNLRRTDYFPGLGWLLSRKLYTQELERNWPRNHWDHWLRSPAVFKNRVIVHPEIPRTYHNGIKGTFMTLDTHNRYFRDIDYNLNRDVAWSSAALALVSQETHFNKNAFYAQATQGVYDNRVTSLLSSCHHVNSFNDLISAAKNSDPAVLCLWVNVNPEIDAHQSGFFQISDFFGVWHEYRRGAYKGVREFYWDYNKYIMIVNGFGPSPFKHLKPEKVNEINRVEGNKFSKYTFEKALEKKGEVAPLKDKDILKSYTLVKDTMGGQSCDQVCAGMGTVCKAEYLELINTCATMGQFFHCTTCDVSFGFEQPAYVIADPPPPPPHNGGVCLITSKPEASTCAAHHDQTARLCPCT